MSFFFFFLSKIGIFTSGSQVCVDDLENSRPLSLDMNEYPEIEIIFAFLDIKLIWNKKIVYILVKEMCDLLSLSFSKKHEKSVAQPE
jgi:hypothetical protein